MNSIKTTHRTQPSIKNKSHYTWKEMKAMEFPTPDYIVHGLVAGEVGMLQSVTNIGKTTLLLNLSISLASGREFLNLADGRTARRVMYLDFETNVSKFRADVERMAEWLTSEEEARLDENLMVYNLNNALADDVRLGDPEGWGRTLERAKDFKPDLIVVDTVSIAFPGIEENDNTKVTEKIMDRLAELAREVQAAVVFAHHIGKEKSEEGRTSLGVHRSRGGSSFAGAARAIYQLEAKADGLWFSFEKIKDIKPEPLAVELNPGTRWFQAAGRSVEGKESRAETLAALVRQEGEIKTGELYEMAKSFAGSRATFERLVEEAIANSLIVRIRHGVLSIPSFPQTV